MEESAHQPESSDENPEIVMYRRRLDRSPSGDFHILRDDQKVLISTLRTALEEAKNRSQKLKEENDVKDDIIEEERLHRKHVEGKLQKVLVDVYNNPLINSELRERLPRAKNYDPLHVDTEGHDDLIATKQIETSNSEIPQRIEENTTHFVTQTSAAHEAAVYEQVPCHPDQNSTTEKVCPFPAPTGPIVTSSNDSDPQAHSTALSTLSPYSASAMSAGSFPFSYSYIDPAHLGLPHLTASACSLATAASSSYLDLPQPAKESGSVVQREQEIDPFPRAGLNAETPSKDMPTLTKDEKRLREEAQQNLPTFPPYIAMSTLNYPNSHFYRPPTDNVSHITRFLAEISTLKKENQEIKAQLEEKKHDLEMIKDELQHEAGNGDKDDSVAALIEMVHSAGKKRERAMAQMVSSAVQDRDVTLSELDRLRLKASERSFLCASNSNNDFSDIEEVVEETYAASACASVETETAESSDATGTDMERSVEELTNLVARQREIMQEEMKGVLQQRDQALIKVAKLEKKLSSYELAEFSNDVIANLKGKLRITETERDIALSKLRKISEDFGEVQLLNNLRQALAHESLKSELKSKQTEKNRCVEFDKWDSVKSNNMTTSLNKQVEENNKLGKKVVLLEHQTKMQSKQIEKLEALISRQRQKLNSLCAGPLLVEGSKT